MMSFGEELKKLRLHDHLCFIYNGQQEWQHFVVEYIRDGLAANQRCLYIFDTHTHKQIRSVLTKAGIDVAAAENSTQLILIHGSRLYFKEGEINLDRAHFALHEAAVKAQNDGFSALRLTSEMDWLLQRLPGSENNIEYEARLTSDLFAKYNALGVGQYDYRQFKPELIRNIVLLYPGLIQNGRVSYKNFYVSPDSLLSKKAIETDPRFWISQIEREDKLVREFQDTAYRLLTIFSKTATPIIVLDEACHIVDANSAACGILETDREKLLGKFLWNYVDPDSHANLRQAIDLFTDFKDLEVECRVNSRVKNLILNSVLINSCNRKQLYLMGMDITERKLLEEKALRLSSVVDSSGLAFISLDLKGRVTSWNKNVEKYLEYQSNEVMGESISRFYPEAFAPTLPEILTQVVSGENVRVRFQFTDKKDEKHQFKMKAFPVRNTEGKIIYASLLVIEERPISD